MPRRIEAPANRPSCGATADDSRLFAYSEPLSFILPVQDPIDCLLSFLKELGEMPATMHDFALVSPRIFTTLTGARI
jgi:hypothetical protein